MPDSLNLTTSYSGKYASSYIAKSILAGVMLNKSLMRKFIGIKSSMNIPVMKLNGIVQPYTSEFNPVVDAIQVSERKLTPAKRTTQLLFEIEHLEQMHISEEMPPGMHNTEMPDSFEEFLIMYIEAAVANEIDNLIWNSDTSASGALGQADGLLKLLTIDPDVNDIAISPFTVDNIIDEMTKVYLGAPEGISKTRNAMFMSVQSHKMYEVALTKSKELAANKDVNGNLLYSKNTMVEAIPNFPANTIVYAPTSNLAFGTDLESDANKVRIVDMRFTTNDDQIRLRMDYKLDSNYGFGEEIVLAKV